jgi:tetratricopeptide (TPR) repeat protein
MSPDKKMIGARLRAEREARRWGRGKMAVLMRTAARRVGIVLPEVESVATSIKLHEWGKHAPGADYRTVYAHVFGKSEDELFAPPPAARLLVPAPGLLVDLSERLASMTGRRAGMATVANLRARAHALRLADDVLAGPDLIGPAFRELEAAVRIHAESTHGEDVERGLLAAIGETAQIAGWIAGDAGQQAKSAETYQLGLSAAQEAGDGVLESNLTGSIAYQEANRGDPGEAVTLAEKAVRAAGPDAPPRAKALAWDRLAWAHARARDAQGAMRALGEAAEAMSEHDGQDDPAYLYWLDAGELQIMEARAYTELHRPLRAIPVLMDVLGRYDTTHTRELALYLSWLVIALTDANEPEEAASTARRMLELSAEVPSERTAERGRLVLARLEPYRDVPAVRDLLAALP